MTDQPTLRDGDLVLRPWTLDDSDATRALHDREIAHWFDFPAVAPSAQEHRAWIEDTRTEWSARTKVTFLVQWRGEPAGTVDVRVQDPGVGVLSWAVYAPYRGRGLAWRAVRLLVEWAFDALGLERVEAHVNPDNRPSVRTALRAGLRREGRLRGNASLGGVRQDTLVLGRRRDDAHPDTREGFTAMLDSTLPTKRAIAQGVLRAGSAGASQVLLCELVYKREWDLPGGVVDPHESPAACVVREVREELDLVVTAGPLLAVNWLPALHGWGDATVFVFDLGTVDARLIERAHLQQREIRGVHWTGPDDWAGRVAPYNERLLRALESRRGDGATIYLEDGTPVT
ncbi:NUDIX hydrolase [Terrabacter carboxydivorans]|uniref:RimJ/RimL family protein N-acetyltransferase n=1 Tax=Terrabacter carboxydivorans TaxID=619730 RepID=A0ABN3L4G3_9MICO